MTDEQLSEIEARANAATPGPWAAGVDHHYFGHAYINTPTDCYEIDDTARMNASAYDDERRHHNQLDADAVFMAHAREDVPALVAEVRRLRTRLLTVDTVACNRGCEIERLRADIERIGRERDDMERACKQQAEELAQFRRMEDDLK